MSRKKQEHEKEPNHERWLVSYADFITLLFAVFVTLYAMSQVDKAKVAKIIASTNEAFGVSKATSAPAFNILDSATLVPLPNILEKSSTEPRPPTGESVYKTKEQKKPKVKDVTDEAFKVRDQAPAHDKELTEAQKKAQEAADKQLLTDLQKQEQLDAAQRVLVDLKKKEAVQMQKIREIEAQVTGKQQGAEQPTPTEATVQERQQEAAHEEKPAPGQQSKARADIAEFKKIKDNIMTYLQQKGVEDKVTLQVGPRGLVISLKDTEFFDSGSATVRPDSLPLLENIAKAVDKYSNSIRIEGHTDTIPIKNSQFPSNWELSTARATNIVHYLVTSHGISPDRLSAVGYGEYRPVSDNGTDEGRQKNRRVDIVVLSNAGEQGEATRAQTPPTP